MHCSTKKKKKNYALLSHQIQENSYKNVFFFGQKLNIIDNRWVKKMENEMSECNNLFLEK